MKTLLFGYIALVLTTGSLFGQYFTQVTGGAIVNDEASSRGSSWGDYDNDGDLDLFVTNDEHSNNYLYKNNSDGTFTKITTGDIVNDGGNSFGASWGDYNNDGYLDLFVANGRHYYNGWHYYNFLYKNNGDYTFTKIITGIIVNDNGFSDGASWGDYDNDGDLDLFVANNDYENNFLYNNNGDGTFTKITTGIIVNDSGISDGASWGDYDNDGDLDLFVANNDYENNFLYNNNGDGTFTKITSGAVVNDGGISTGASWGDYDNDGDLDLFVTNGQWEVSQNNFLYKNNGDGTFTKVTSGNIINDLGNSYGSSWGDFDNDGDLDLFVTNKDYYINNILYSNNGDGSFTKITSDPVVNTNAYSLGTSWGDYDNDGDIDLFVANSDGKNFLFQNNGNSNNWINIICIGMLSNTSAIGAKIRVKAIINGNPVWQMNEILGQAGGRCGGQNSLNAEFGLGDATVIDTLIIEWPSGIIDVFTEVAINQFLTLVEGGEFPEILIQEEELLFDTVYVGNYVSRILIISNIGTYSLIINDIISDNPDFTIDTTSFTLEPSQNLEVNVIFSPDSSGFYSGTLIIKSNDHINPVISVSLSGYALSQISISETGLEFDTVTVGFSLSRQFVISNLYTEDLAIQTTISDNPDYTIDISDFILEPGQSQEISVMFSPDSSGFSYGTLIIMTNDTLSPLMYVNLIGYALSQYIISKEELEFDSVALGYSGSSQLIISNISTEEITIDTILSDNPDYTVDISNFILGPEQSREISITFSPGNPGFSAGTLTIKTDNPIDSVKYVYLFGYGYIPPQISITPDEFQADLQTGDSIQQILTIENKGGTDLNFKINILEVFDTNNTSTKSQNTNVNIPGLSFYELLQNWGNGIENQSNIFKKSYTRSGKSPNEYSWDLLYTDPDEENLIYDIRNVYGCITDSELVFKLESNYSWSSPVNHGVTAIYIDADQNVFTGLNPENVGEFGWNLGIDYIVTRDFQLFQNGLYVWENITDKFIWLDSLSTNIISENSNEIIIGINRKHFLKSFSFSLLSGSLHEDYGDYVPDPGNGHITLYFPVSWLYLNITGGKIPPENQEIITVTFNASQLQPGPYKAQLHLFTNDPEIDTLSVPVSLNVSHATGLENDQIHFQNSFSLYQNYPNPFSYKTTITYNLPKPVMVNLSVFNIYGKLISTLVKQRQLAGLYSIEWNASEFPSGIYFFRLEAGKLYFTRKCTIIR